MKTTIEIYKGKTIFQKENGKFSTYLSEKEFYTLPGIRNFINNFLND